MAAGMTNGDGRWRWTRTRTKLAPWVTIMLCCLSLLARRRKGQATNEMLFGGVSLGKTGATSLDAMTEQAEKGIEIK